jgi:hypothetical protein
MAMALRSYVNELRELESFAEKEMILLMDSCPSHAKVEILSVLAKARIKPNSFALHTAQIFQMLDLSFFGDFKKQQQAILPIDFVLVVVTYVVKIMHHFVQTSGETNV